MSRQPRIQFPGAFYHITSRGNRHADIFLDDHDYLTWQDTFGKTAERFGFLSHSFCQMPNHFHILLETPEANLSDGMQFLNSVYSQHFNKRHDRDGHMLQGRYNALLVAKDSYFAELGRYLTLNPVRAGLARHAGEWRWSSYRFTAGLAEPPAWLETELMLAHFGQNNDATRFTAFRSFVAAGMGVTNPLAKRRQRLSEQAIATRTAPKSLAEYAAHPDRDQAIANAAACGAFSKKEIADYFGIERKTVTRTAKDNS
jgi:REP element-mobilizing transposase RayT